MTEMQKRYIYAGIGVLVLAVAAALPVFGQPRFGGGPGGWGMGGGGMMGGPRVGQNVAPVTSIDAAAARAREALAAYGASDLAVAEVMEFSNHFYVLVKEKSTGVGAFELIVERSGVVHPEPGPNMMWNTKYGHAAGFGGGMMGGGTMGGGMMGGYGYGPGYGPGPQGFSGPRGPNAAVTPAAQPVSKDRAKQIATQYLAQGVPGATPDAGTGFYGYFTFDVERSGKIVGMLSVNAYSGQVWYHTWHGTFVTEKEF